MSKYVWTVLDEIDLCGLVIKRIPHREFEKKISPSDAFLFIYFVLFKFLFHPTRVCLVVRFLLI